MGEAKRRKKLDQSWGQPKLTQPNDVEAVSQTKFDSGAIPEELIPEELIPEELIESRSASNTVRLRPNAA